MLEFGGTHPGLGETPRMPDTPFNPSLHRKLKDNLQHNLKRIQKLQGDKGAKLRFDPATGRFEVDGNAFVRTLRNLGKDHQNTASSEEMFEQPLLLTLYECRKAMLKADQRPEGAGRKPALPPGAFDDSLDALRYLRDVTYAGKQLHQQQITRVLNRAHQLALAATRDGIDGLIAQWVSYSLPADLTRLVTLAASSANVKSLINGGLTTYGTADPAGRKALTDGLLGPVYDEIYSAVYKTGGGAGVPYPYTATPRSFEKEVAAIAQRFGAVAQPQSERIDLATWLRQHRGRSYGGFIHFTKRAWGGAEARGRVYIHLRADPQGAAALSALRAIFKALERPIDGLSLGADFHKFKIGSLRMIYGCSDSVVMWTRSVETSKKLAEAMAKAAGQYTVPGLPLGVKPTRVPGVGVSTEPEYQFDPVYQLLEHRLNNYSFGMHRAEVVARGLIAAAAANGGTLPDLPTCVNAVAQMFAEYGLDYKKPYKMAQ